MVKIIHVESATDPQEPFTWVADGKPGSLYAFHKVIEERQRYLLRLSNLLSTLGSLQENQHIQIDATIRDFIRRQPGGEFSVYSKGRWTTYKQGSLTIMTEETI